MCLIQNVILFVLDIFYIYADDLQDEHTLLKKKGDILEKKII